MSAPSYPITNKNKLKRVHERGHYDHETVHAVLDSAMLGHVSFVKGDAPFCIPTLVWREGTRLFWHGSSASRMIKMAKDGFAACVTVSHLDGLVFARSGMHHSANYRSVICYGTARLVTDAEEKAQSLSAVIDRFFPGRDATLRPITEQEAKATGVIAMEIDSAAAKIRAEGVNDDPGDIDFPVWAGVIPVTQVLGEPENCPHVKEGQTPGAPLAGYANGRRFDDALREAQRLYEDSL